MKIERKALRCPRRHVLRKRENQHDTAWHDRTDVAVQPVSRGHSSINVFEKVVSFFFEKYFREKKQKQQQQQQITPDTCHETLMAGTGRCFTLFLPFFPMFSGSSK